MRRTGVAAVRATILSGVAVTIACGSRAGAPEPPRLSLAPCSVGGIEARYALLWAPSVLEVKLVGFYDVGRVFGPGEEVALTTTGLHHGGGGEVMARFGRNTVIVLGMGFGAEGSQFLFGTTWSY